MDELTREDVERMYPGWRLAERIGRQPYALRRTGPAIETRGEDWTDLADEIRRAEAHIANDEYARRSHR